MTMIMRGLVAGAVAVSVTFSACGKKKEDKDAEAPPFIGALALGNQALGYGISVLASTNKTAPGASLSANDGMTLDSSQDPNLLDCGTNGEPWGRASGQRLNPSDAKYSQTVFYCQTNSQKSPDTLAGTLAQYKRVLCDVERVLGSIEYTAEGKVYSNVSLSTTEACGWPADQVMSGITANITAYAPTSGDWQKRIKILITGQIDYDLSYTIKNDLVAFKAVEGWSQQARQQSGDANSNIGSTASGLRGSVISIDVANGILRAESVDTYWSRRYRFYMKGALDGTTGIFTSISDGQGIVANFDHQTGFYTEIATATGSESGGFLHGAYQYSGNTGSPRSATVSTSNTECSKSGGCTGLSAISFGTETADFDFLMIGAAWDSQTNSRTAVQDWLSGAGAPTFTSVTKGKTL